MTTAVGALMSSRLLARNVALNLVGWGVPALSALLAMPLLVRGLGDARFGILAIAWTTIGYFSLFDLGIGRALTHMVADRYGRGERDAVSSVVWTAISILVPVGIVGAMALLLLADLLVNALHVPAGLRSEAVLAFRMLSLAIPFTAVAASFRGLLEASQQFGTINALRVPYGLLTFLGPVAVLPFSRSVAAAVAVLTVGRMVLCMAYAAACVRAFPELATAGHGVQRAHARSLVTYGGWMTISNVISPLMNTFDRFIIGAVASVSMVSYYAAPHELVTKMWLYTAALWPVFFPAFALAGTRDPARSAALFDRALRLTFAGLIVPTFLLVLLAPDIMGIWLGPQFALHSTRPMQILAVAVLVNSIGQGAYTLIQGLGRPDLTGKFHLVELPLYAVLLWMLIPRFGLVGVAVAWAVRASIDAVLLLLACPVLLAESRASIRRMLLFLTATMPMMVLAAVTPSTSLRLALATLGVPPLAIAVWWVVLTKAERRAPAEILSAVLPRT